MTVLSFYINIGINFFKMFTKHEFNLEILMTVRWSFSKSCILILRSAVSLVDLFMGDVWILSQPSKLTPRFVEIFFRPN